MLAVNDHDLQNETVESSITLTFKFSVAFCPCGAVVRALVHGSNYPYVTGSNLSWDVGAGISDEIV
jgi:hypothetical protein